MLRIRVTTAEATILETELITAGRRGLQCAFAFSDDWEGLAKTVIVRGVVKRDIVLVGDTITVPGECLEREQFPLHIGVYGANGEGEIVIPTIWADFGKIRPSARPSGVSPDEVTPDVVAQIQQNSTNALYLAQQLTQRANSGEFDGKDGATGPQGAAGPDGPAGNSTWTFASADMTNPHRIRCDNLVGRETVDPAVGDIAVADGRYVYQITGIVEDWEPGGAFKSAILVLKADIKGETGSSGVYVGTDEPTDPNVNVWIDPDGGAEITIWEGGSY